MSLGYSIALAALAAGALLGCQSDAVVGPYEVTCNSVRISTLHDPRSFGLYDRAQVCYPDTPDGATFPLHLFAHGDTAGGFVFNSSYGVLQRHVASFGFVVPAYLSCWFDGECDNGASSFLEALKTIEYLEQNPKAYPVDFSKPYTVSGQSTGARVAMMLAALKDTPQYLSNTPIAANVTASMRKILTKMVAFIGDHTDPMCDLKQNPDIPNYDISKSPVLLITGTKDWVEPYNSSWKNFVQISTPDKIHVNFAGDGHLTPNDHLNPLIAYFAQYHALGDINARDKIYGNHSDSLVNSKLIAPPGATNNGAADVGFLACSSEGLTVPLKLANYCSTGDAKQHEVIV